MTEQARSIALAPLNGPHFQRDNACVHGIIKLLVLEGPGRTVILRFDFTADITRVRVSVTVMSRMLTTPWSILAMRVRRFTFEKFIE